jgi:hypothetical protein
MQHKGNFFFHEWLHYFNKMMGACNDDDLPEFANIYESPFYHALWKEGAATLNEKLHYNGVLSNDVTFFAPCRVGGFKTHDMDPGKLNSVQFMPNEQYDSMASTAKLRWIWGNRMASTSCRRSSRIPWRI